MSGTAIERDQAPRLPGVLLGVGLGGFVDGIVFHQILQWHHMLSDTGDNPMTTVAGLESNTLADGFFHLATWLLVAVAMTLTVTAWREGKLAPPWTAHFGMLLAGWGVFNVVEGVIDHELLGLHHVEITLATSDEPEWIDRRIHPRDRRRQEGQRQMYVVQRSFCIVDKVRNQVSIAVALAGFDVRAIRVVA